MTVNARYDKVIVLEKEDSKGEVVAVVIFDTKIHVPVFFGVNKYGMDDIINMFGGNANIGIPGKNEKT